MTKFSFKWLQYKIRKFEENAEIPSNYNLQAVICAHLNAQRVKQNALK